MKLYPVTRNFDAGWAKAKAGDTILLTDGQAANLAPWLGEALPDPVEPEAPQADSENGDPPGAPPPLNTGFSSQAPAGGKGRGKVR